MKEEFWRTITDAPLYDISTLGRVRNSKTNKILKGYINKYGYEMISLESSVYKRKITIGIHILVARYWIPNFHNYPEVNHKDENKLNNSVENLEWCDRNYNVHYGTAINRTANTLANKLGKPIKVKSDKDVILFKGIGFAARYYNIPRKSIESALKGSGYIRKYNLEFTKALPSEISLLDDREYYIIKTSK